MRLGVVSGGDQHDIEVAVDVITQGTFEASSHPEDEAG